MMSQTSLKLLALIIITVLNAPLLLAAPAPMSDVEGSFDPTRSSRSAQVLNAGGLVDIQSRVVGSGATSSTTTAQATRTSGVPPEETAGEEATELTRSTGPVPTSSQDDPEEYLPAIRHHRPSGRRICAIVRKGDKVYKAILGGTTTTRTTAPAPRETCTPSDPTFKSDGSPDVNNAARTLEPDEDCVCEPELSHYVGDAISAPSPTKGP